MTSEDIVEQLRFGIPPRGATLRFTVARDGEIARLRERLEDNQSSALLVHANYGAGKSHLLRVLEEIALERGFVVAFVVADANGGIRFDRMDTVLGEVCKELQVPGSTDRGIGTLFDAYKQTRGSRLDAQTRADRQAVSNNERWDSDDRFCLWAPGIYVALRAWRFMSDDPNYREYIQEWLTRPNSYRGQRRNLYLSLVKELSVHFRDPRPQWRFMNDDVFSFHKNGYRYSWAALRDVDFLSRCSGFRGLVILVDEFEDVIYNLARVNYKQEAFRNLFRFFAGRDSLGQSYFAVTPDFASKCRRELLRRGVYELHADRFDSLPRFQLSSIGVADMFSLSKKIRDVHSSAYDWGAEGALGDDEMERYCEELMKLDTPNKIRHVVTSIVRLLDERMEID